MNFSSANKCRQWLRCLLALSLWKPVKASKEQDGYLCIFRSLPCAHCNGFLPLSPSCLTSLQQLHWWSLNARANILTQVVTKVLWKGKTLLIV